MAGVNDNGNLGVDTADTQTLGVATRIAALGPVTIKGFVLDDAASSDHSGFEAEQIAKITAAGQTLFKHSDPQKYLDFEGLCPRARNPQDVSRTLCSCLHPFKHRKTKIAPVSAPPGRSLFCRSVVAPKRFETWFHDRIQRSFLSPLQGRCRSSPHPSAERHFGALTDCSIKAGDVTLLRFTKSPHSVKVKGTMGHGSLLRAWEASAHRKPAAKIFSR